MPYINPKYREAFLIRGVPDNAGELNYILTQVLRSYWVKGARNYQVINDIIGALEGAKAEFYRRIAVPYEEKKIKENGDVYLDSDLA